MTMTGEDTILEENKDEKPTILEKIANGYHDGKREAEEDERARAAAVKIQQAWRQRNGRVQLQKEYLSSERRWRVSIIEISSEIDH